VKVRIFERDSSLRHLLELICQWVSNDVEVADFPVRCPSYGRDGEGRGCCSTRDSILIIDAHLSPISGLDWVESQAQGPCQVPVANKLVLATNWTPTEVARADRLGCSIMHKPFRTQQLKDWLEQRIKR